MSYTDIFKRHGHVESGHRDPETRLLCDRCGTPMSSAAAEQICPRAEWVHKSVMDEAINSMAEGIGATTGSGKVAKKVRKMYAKNVEKLARQSNDALYKTFVEHVRPRPRWIPERAWKVIQRMVLQHYV